MFNPFILIGPWFNSVIFTVPGLLMHVSGILFLLCLIIKNVSTINGPKHAGFINIISSYIWILTPIHMAPIILLKVSGIPGQGIEVNAPQTLVYGWVLLFGMTMIPFLIHLYYLREKSPKFGGNWFIFIFVHLGCLFLWSSIFIDEFSLSLHGLTYVFWFSAIALFVREIFAILIKLEEKDIYFTSI